MLKKANRLKSRGDFKRTLAGRRICANDCFVLYGLAAPTPVAGSSALAQSSAAQGGNGETAGKLKSDQLAAPMPDLGQETAAPDSIKTDRPITGLATGGTKAASKQPGEPRFGFIVSKKIHKRAVQRNRIRRRLRELVRTWLLTERREAMSQYRALVFIARSGSLEAGYQDLKNRLERCFRNP